MCEHYFILFYIYFTLFGPNKAIVSSVLLSLSAILTLTPEIQNSIIGSIKFKIRYFKICKLAIENQTSERYLY